MGYLVSTVDFNFTSTTTQFSTTLSNQDSALVFLGVWASFRLLIFLETTTYDIPLFSTPPGSRYSVLLSLAFGLLRCWFDLHSRPPLGLRLGSSFLGVWASVSTFDFYGYNYITPPSTSSQSHNFACLSLAFGLFCFCSRFYEHESTTRTPFDLLSV